MKVDRRRVRIRRKWVTWKEIEKKERSKEKSELTARKKEREEQSFG